MNRGKRQPKLRLDDLLVECRLAADLREAVGLIMAGRVRVNERVESKPGTRVPRDAQVTVARRKEYVSRGAHKLTAALRAFEVPVAGRVCADVGSSTGGFTEVLLEHGAERVYAIDSATNELAWELRRSERVVVMEGAPVSRIETLPDPIDLVTIDVSLVSLRLVVEVVRNWLRPDGTIVALLKPQYEADATELPPGGVIRDTKLLRSIVERTLSSLDSQDFRVRGIIVSPIRGGAGNREFLVRLDQSPSSSPFDWAEKLDEIFCFLEK